MVQKIQSYKLEIIVLISGAIVMILEMVGSRVLAPALGNSTFVWTSLIGVILGSLSLGYWWGGRLADQKASLQLLSKILLFSGILVEILNVFKSPIINVFENFSDIRVASLLAALVLFAPASVLLGTVTPLVVRLKLQKLSESGSTVGSLYALSTIGSIFGTFATGFFLLSWLGTNNILHLLAFSLVFLSAFAAFEVGTIKKAVASITIISLFILGKADKDLQEKYGFIDKDTSYSRVFIFDTKENQNKRPIRVMTLDKMSSSAMYLDGDDLVFDYTKFYNLIEHFQPAVTDTLMIGAAAYSYPKEFLARYPDTQLDVVEIDPGVTKLAKKYFNLKDDPNLKIYHEDGRTFLNKNDKEYGAILLDAFSTMYAIPYHLTTKETVSRIYESLNEDGVVISNIISAAKGPKSMFLSSEYHTYKEYFPNVLVFKVKNTPPEEVQNLILVGLKNPKAPQLQNSNTELQSMLENRWQGDFTSSTLVLTDDYAPVERFVMKLL